SEIQPEDGDLERYQLDINMIHQMLSASDISMPGTSIDDGTDSITTRIQAQMQSMEDLETFNVTVDPEDGEEVTLGDISTIERVSDSGETISRTNRSPSILINVLEESNGNTDRKSTRL